MASERVKQARCRKKRTAVTRCVGTALSWVVFSPAFLPVPLERRDAYSVSRKGFSSPLQIGHFSVRTGYCSVNPNIA